MWNIQHTSMKSKQVLWVGKGVHSKLPFFNHFHLHPVKPIYEQQTLYLFYSGTFACKHMFMQNIGYELLCIPYISACHTFITPRPIPQQSYIMSTLQVQEWRLSHGIDYKPPSVRTGHQTNQFLCWSALPHASKQPVGLHIDSRPCSKTRNLYNELFFFSICHGNGYNWHSFPDTGENDLLVYIESPDKIYGLFWAWLTQLQHSVWKWDLVESIELDPNWIYEPVSRQIKQQKSACDETMGQANHTGHRQQETPPYLRELVFCKTS